jgi:hypothetical protein
MIDTQVIMQVTYCDVDIVFVNSNVTELSEALKISAGFKKAVNDRCNCSRLTLDGVFQRLLLLQNKRYAAIEVPGRPRKSRVLIRSGESTVLYPRQSPNKYTSCHVTVHFV